MRRLILLCLCVFAATAFAAEGTGVTSETETPDNENQELTPKELAAREVADTLEEPLYTPFVERYVLDELKSLRQDLASARVEMMQQVVDRELSVADKAIGYSTNTVNYFFYLMAAVSSILVIIGWTSVREIKEKVHGLADTEINKIIQVYEQRLRAIEKQLTQKTKHIDENREEIEKTNELHALWLRVGLEHTPGAKIAIYDEILKRRPKDYEALTYKAAAVLELDEPQWAVSLCLQALAIDPEFSHAFYQLACAKAAQGHLDEAVEDLSEALDRMEIPDEALLAEPAFQQLKDYGPFKELLESRNRPQGEVPDP